MNPLVRLLTVCIRGYQLIVSPWLPPTCKYYPTCSSYFITALQHHGLSKGLVLGLKRLGCCHPWSNGGYDPVPGTPRLIPASPEEASHDCDCDDGHNGR